MSPRTFRLLLIVVFGFAAYGWYQAARTLVTAMEKVIG